MKSSLSRVFAGLSILLGGLAVLAGMAASPPIMLRIAGAATPQEWSLLSDIGQAYGSTAALLTALSLLGLAASIATQARAVRAATAQAQRTIHMELSRFVMDDPMLFQADGYRWNGPADDPFVRLIVCSNLWLTSWLAHYELGQIDDVALRALCAQHFASESTRDHWAQTRTNWRSGMRNRRSRAFFRIVEQEYDKALQTPAIPTRIRPVVPAEKPQVPNCLLLTASITAGLALALFARRRPRE